MVLGLVLAIACCMEELVELIVVKFKFFLSNFENMNLYKILPVHIYNSFMKINISLPEGMFYVKPKYLLTTIQCPWKKLERIQNFKSDFLPNLKRLEKNLQCLPKSTHFCVYVH